MKNGIINLRKEAGMTSHDAVFKLRRILAEKKIGHGGTLDPDVVGVLPIALGKGTRVLEFMTDSGKVYEGTVTLGFATTTEDSSGEVVARTPVAADLSEADVDQAVTAFIGDIRQVPPLYSAVKVKGKRLYEYAREGLPVERPERYVHIKSFERTSPLRREGDVVSFDFRVACGKGTYVRTLAVDLGQALGYASHMSFLRRTQAGGLDLADSLSLDQIAERVAADDWSFIQPIEKGLSDLAGLAVTDSQAQDLSHGRFIPLDREEELLVAYHDGLALAILQKREDAYKPKKVLRHVGD